MTYCMTVLCEFYLYLKQEKLVKQKQRNMQTETTSIFGLELFVTLNALCPKFKEHFVSLVCRRDEEMQI